MKKKAEKLETYMVGYRERQAERRKLEDEKSDEEKSEHVAEVSAGDVGSEKVSSKIEEVNEKGESSEISNWGKRGDETEVSPKRKFEDLGEKSKSENIVEKPSVKKSKKKNKKKSQKSFAENSTLAETENNTSVVNTLEHSSTSVETKDTVNEAKNVGKSSVERNAEVKKPSSSEMLNQKEAPKCESILKPDPETSACLNGDSRSKASSPANKTKVIKTSCEKKVKICLHKNCAKTYRDSVTDVKKKKLAYDSSKKPSVGSLLKVPVYKHPGGKLTSTLVPNGKLANSNVNLKKKMKAKNKAVKKNGKVSRKVGKNTH